MNTHEHLVEQEEIMAYLDGELPVDKAAQAATHRQECRQCQQFANDLRSVSQAMTQWEVEPSDRELDSRLIEALEEHKKQSIADVRPSRWHGVLRSSRWRRWGWMTAAAGVAVLLIVATIPKAARMPTSQMPTSQQLALAEREQNRQFAASPGAAMAPQSHEELLRRQQSALFSNLEVETTEARDREQLAYAHPPFEATTAGQNSSPVLNAPMIARKAELTITTKDFEAARAQVDEILKRESGYIGEMSVSSPADTERKLTAVLRVPADHLEAAIAELKKVGRVESESQAGEEVTSQYVDLQARLTNARNTEQRMTELLRTRTGKLEEVVAVEEKLSEVREQIERMEAEKKALTKRVDFGTVTLSLAEERHAQMRIVPQSVGTQFRNAAVEGYRSVVGSVISVLLFLMSWGPSLLLWGAILFVPARLIWRKARTPDAE
jgi:negative regulator of sigma E activity